MSHLLHRISEAVWNISLQTQIVLFAVFVSQLPIFFLALNILDMITQPQRTTWTDLENKHTELTSRRKMELQRLLAMGPKQIWEYEPNPTLKRWRNTTCGDCTMPGVNFEINNLNRCRSNTHIDILILINSNGPNLQLRQAIRWTWGNRKLVKKLKIQYVFLIGINSNVTVNEMVNQESIVYHDIVMGRFPESYTNLCVKTLMGMQWASSFCTNAKYVFKTDDDILLNIQNLTTIVKNNIQKDNTIYGNCMFSGVPHRCPFSKWYTPFRYYPYRWYGEFCLGSAFIMRHSCAEKLYKSSRNVSYFHVEDVYMSALITAHAQVDRRFLGGMLMEELPTLTCPWQQGHHASLLSNATSFYSIWYRTSDNICGK